MHKGFEYARTPEPDAHGVRALRRRSRKRHRRLRLRLRPGGDRDRARLLDNGAHIVAPTTSMAARAGCSTRCAGDRPGSRRPLSIFPMPTALEAAMRPDTRMIWVETPTNPTARSSSTSSALPPSRAPSGVLTACRQHLCQSLDAAAAGARLRHRRALDDQIPQRPFRHGRRHRGRRRQHGAARAPGVSAECRRRHSGAVRFISRAARGEDAGAAHGAAFGFGAAHRRSGSRSIRGSRRVLYPGLLASAACAGAAADARLRRHDLGRARRAPATSAPLSRTLPAVHAGRKPRRRRKPDRASGADDARLDAAGSRARRSASPIGWCGFRSASRMPTI